jgi:hypothetical protein
MDDGTAPLPSICELIAWGTFADQLIFCVTGRCMGMSNACRRPEAALTLPIEWLERLGVHDEATP